MKRYVGYRTDSGCRIEVISSPTMSYPLNPRFDLRNHSPDGFNFGYGGSGPAQTALAILADCLGDKDAVRYYQDFKFAVIALIEDDHFTLAEDNIKEVVEQLKLKRMNY